MTVMFGYQGSFEVHATIRAMGTLEAFRDWCAVEKCKCVRIVLARGEQTEQPMATWRLDSTVLSHVLSDSVQRVQKLERDGFAVIRLKIEANPANDDVPLTDDAALLHPLSNYFEHHVKLRRQATAERETLMRTCLDHAAHLSRNAWRKSEAGFEERFVTQRSYRKGRSSSEKRLQRLLAVLDGLGEQVIDVESEYAVYDSNLALDAGWLPSDPS